MGKLCGINQIQREINRPIRGQSHSANMTNLTTQTTFPSHSKISKIDQQFDQTMRKSSSDP